MPSYIVAVHKTPGMRYVDSRRFRADDISGAVIEAKRLASIMVSRREIAKYRIWFTLIEFGSRGLGPHLVAKGPLSREGIGR